MEKRKKKLIIFGITLVIILATVGTVAALNGWFGGGDTISPDSLTRGLVGYWAFEEGYGQTAYDASGNGNDGTLHNGPEWTQGKVGGALSFDEDDEYIEISDTDSLDISDAITIGAWINPSEGGWRYKRQITIDPVTPEADFQVKLELTPSNFDYSKARSDGADLRFYQTDRTKLKYWIEEWNASGTSTVWIKVSASGTDAIYMYYGNSNAEAESNGEEVFEFFDDFSGSSLNTNKWVEKGDGSLEITNGILHTYGAKALYGKTNISNIFDKYIELKSKFKGISGTDIETGFGYITSSGLWRGNRTGEWINAIGWDRKGITVADGLGTEDSLNSVGGELWDYSNYFKYRIKFDNNRVRVWKEGSSILDITSAATQSNSTLPLLLVLDHYSNQNDYDEYLDWIFVRKYASNEPVLTVGIETTVDQYVVVKPGAYGIKASTSTVWGVINDQVVSTSLSSDSWNYVVLTYDKNAGGTEEMKLYINGN
ncbi:MAG: DUF2341 domain-containing protein, partial [Candidatus Thorarchaeota archaeon]